MRYGDKGYSYTASGKWRGCFASRPFAAREGARYYYATPSHPDLGSELSDDETYGVGVTPISKKKYF